MVLHGVYKGKQYNNQERVNKVHSLSPSVFSEHCLGVLCLKCPIKVIENITRFQLFYQRGRVTYKEKYEIHVKLPATAVLQINMFALACVI